MKRRLILAILIAVFIGFPLGYFVIGPWLDDEGVVPNEMVVEVTFPDSWAIPDSLKMTLEEDYLLKAPSATYNTEFYDYRMSDNVIMQLDTLNVLTIYHPSITVKWDTLK